MWQVYAFRAADLIRERQQEAARDRLGRESRTSPDGPGPAATASPGLVRRVAAGGLHRVASVAVSVSRFAGSAAARLEGRAA